MEACNPGQTAPAGAGGSQPLLMLAYYFPPQNASGAMRPARFAKYLPQFGYTPAVISLAAPGQQDALGIHPVPAERAVPPMTALATRAAQLLESACLPYNDRLPWVPHALAEAARIRQHLSFSTVFSTSPPLATHVAALWIKHRYGVRWVADLRDPLWDNPFRVRQIGRPYDAVLERWIFRNADALVANTDVVAEAWRSRYPQWRHKIVVIWNGFDPEDKLQAVPLPTRSYQTILHAGSLYAGRHPTILLASVKRLLAQGGLEPTALRIELIGPLENSAMAPFQDLVRQGCLHYTGTMVPKCEANKCAAASDFLLLVDINELNAGLQVPAKLFDYIRFGRPIMAITTRNSPAERILSRSGVPHVCLYPDDREALIDGKVLSFLRVPTAPVVATPWFWNEFDGRTQAGALARILDRLTGIEPSPADRQRQ